MFISIRRDICFSLLAAVYILAILSSRRRYSQSADSQAVAAAAVTGRQNDCADNPVPLELEQPLPDLRVANPGRRLDDPLFVEFVSLGSEQVMQDQRVDSGRRAVRRPDALGSRPGRRRQRAIAFGTRGRRDCRPGARAGPYRPRDQRLCWDRSPAVQGLTVLTPVLRNSPVLRVTMTSPRLAAVAASKASGT